MPNVPVTDATGTPARPGRRELFRLTGAAGAGVVAGRLLGPAPATAQASETAPGVQRQPTPASVPGDRTTADIIVETLIT